MLTCKDEKRGMRPLTLRIRTGGANPSRNQSVVLCQTRVRNLAKQYRKDDVEGGIH